MGKKIDGFVLTLALAGAYYFFFRGAFESRALSLALSLLCCGMTRRLLRRLLARASRSRFLARRRIRKSAGSISMHLACLPREEAIGQLEGLLKSCYEGDYAVDLIQSPPSAALDQSRLFEVWKRHRGEDRLAVCATCTCEPSCRMMASGLRQPRIALVDAQMISQLAAANPGAISPPPESRRAPRRLRHALALLVNRKNAPRCLLFSVAMLAMFVFSANYCYLISSMALLFLALASLHRAPRPSKLF